MEVGRVRRRRAAADYDSPRSRRHVAHQDAASQAAEARVVVVAESRVEAGVAEQVGVPIGAVIDVVKIVREELLVLKVETGVVNAIQQRIGEADLRKAGVAPLLIRYGGKAGPDRRGNAGAAGSDPSAWRTEYGFTRRFARVDVDAGIRIGDRGDVGDVAVRG